MLAQWSIIKGAGPNLYRQTRFKHRTMHKEMQCFNWIRNIRSIDSEDLHKFILLFNVLQGIHLSGHKDSIR
jgi:hypothetical protein